MEDPELIATLISENDFTKHVFNYRENRNRCVRPVEEFNEEPVLSSRESTPAFVISQIDGSGGNPSRLLLQFNKPPKDPSKGYAFGAKEQKCDVLLAPKGVRSTSRIHFHISFDVINNKQYLVLRDCSVNGTAVSYNDQAKDEKRHHFTWILNLPKGEEGEEVEEWKVKVHLQNLEFEVQLASHETCQTDYDENLDKFLILSRTGDPPLGGLTIDSYTTEVTPSQSRTPGQRPVYISDGSLGKGSFGTVDKVINASTGAIYARKTFHEPMWTNSRGNQREKWLDKIRREIRIMRDHPHEHIVPILDSQVGPRPFLVMKYFPLGSLRSQHDRASLTAGDAVDVLFQGLIVLEHLHSRGVAYRDLKPDNILVEQRSPLRLQFADFGLANDQPDLKTFCGTERYAAPEIFMGESYTTAVDVWSLGVIVLEYAYDFKVLGQTGRTNRTPKAWECVLTWCRGLVEDIEDLGSEPLIDLLSRGMLRMNASERLSARACLAKGSVSGVFNESTPSLGTATPTGTTFGTRSNECASQPREKKPDTVSGRTCGPAQSPMKSLFSPETSFISFGSKRHRSPVVTSPSNPSDENRAKRRLSASRLSKVDNTSKVHRTSDNVSADRSSKGKGSDEDDDSSEEDDELSVDADITQLHVPQANDSDNALLLRRSSSDIEGNVDQRVEDRISCYSSEDLVPRNSELKEVNLHLQAPSKVSSHYGSMTDDAPSFMLAAREG
ncbi:MAG: hypothetical protein HETSPECPRED_001811 [Heterodermia speciosa]|uniref:non-specific serine/threonine protein kinase n=1 Tax=Heterodermia speciosa TaxID=116794 RepID=A0A8H3J2J4_9LECA|nr:MAG: hypothetical protein HETSPECPRED_001811 [Heterodermia speciosa]